MFLKPENMLSISLVHVQGGGGEDYGIFMIYLT